MIAAFVLAFVLFSSLNAAVETLRVRTLKLTVFPPDYFVVASFFLLVEERQEPVSGIIAYSDNCESFPAGLSDNAEKLPLGCGFASVGINFIHQFTDQYFAEFHVHHAFYYRPARVRKQVQPFLVLSQAPTYQMRLS